jgi:DNA mismatch repair protein MutL
MSVSQSATIKILDERLCNQIAAGEVVERPASVVKELVENSLDAGADEILVELAAGGRKLIRVSDNGCGMNRQDVFLALERHATSKISCAEDLFALHSLGFRGEALASVASVSRFRLRSCAGDDGLGQELLVEGGQVRKAQEVGMARGTLIEARDLFFNQPARRKFLRTEQTELGHCADIVSKLALARPQVSFRLLHDNRALLDLRREKGLPERVAALLGTQVLQDMQQVEAADEETGLRLSGLVGQPALSRSTTAHLYTFINGRSIRDRVVQHAVLDGYRHLLMKGRYPVVVLFLEIPPGQVDVNVHPTKHEVRFRQQRQVHDFIAAALGRKLKASTWVQNQGGCPPEPEAASLIATAGEKGEAGTVVHDAVQPLYARPSQDAPVALTLPPVPAPAPVAVPDLFSAATPQGGSFFANLRYLGQYHNSYLLCQDGEDLVLIDQHAAHERIGFEKLRADFSRGAVPRQSLLFPEMLELDFRSTQALDAHLDDLAALGFEVEPFGGKSYALKAVPALLANVQCAPLLVDIALELDQQGRSSVLLDHLDEVLIMIACHGVIRANQALEPREVRALLEQLDRVDFRGNCPHGRPVSQRLTLRDVERMFRR